MAFLNKKNIHWWKFGNDTQLNDETGSENLSKTGTPSYTAMKFGNGIYTNAAGSYASKSSFTIDYDKTVYSCVIKTDFSVTDGVTSDGNNHAIIFPITDGNNYAYFGGGNPNLLLEIRISGTYYRFQMTTGVTWSASTNTDLLLVFDRTGIAGGSDTCRLYINGSLVFNSTLAVVTQSNTSCTFYILSNQGASQPLDGSLDNLKMYNDSSSETITQINKNDDYEGFYIDNQVTII
jgi:hypothetical protein